MENKLIKVVFKQAPEKGEYFATEFLEGMYEVLMDGDDGVGSWVRVEKEYLELIDK